jgi:hypothetical protein
MKRCPICSSYASNDATTCFDCLYSFEHLTSLEEEKPSEVEAAAIERIRVPIKAPKQKAEVTEVRRPLEASTKSDPIIDAHVTKSTSKRRAMTTITIAIDCADGEVIIEDRRPHN